MLQVLHSRDVFREIPVAVVTANNRQELEIACYTMGAVAVIEKPFVAQVVRKRIDSIIDMYQSNRDAKETLVEQLRRTNRFYMDSVDALSDMAEFRKYEPGAHIKRIKGLTKIMAEEYMNLFPDSGLNQDIIEIIVRASAIHDIGKMAIPDNILLKPGSLNDDEWQVMMSHTTKGCEMLSRLPNHEGEEYAIFYDVCRSHHERYDGGGYPDGLIGDAIPLAAQIVSIVHSYDSLISKRVYKHSHDKETAFRMIINEEKGNFSPKMIQCFQSAKYRMESFVDNCM